MLYHARSAASNPLMHCVQYSADRAGWSLSGTLRGLEGDRGLSGMYTLKTCFNISGSVGKKCEVYTD
jgi:hypothetical protein